VVSSWFFILQLIVLLFNTIWYPDQVMKYSFVVFFLFGDSPATSYEDETDSVPKHQHIKFRNREITPKKNTTISTRQKFAIKNKHSFVGFVCLICSLCIVLFIVTVCSAICYGPFGCELSTIMNKN